MSIDAELKDVHKKLDDIEKKQEMMQKLYDLDRDKKMKMGERPSTHIHEMMCYNRYYINSSYMTEDTIKKICYTKEEVDSMIAFAVEEAHRIDEASMAKHNREATIISMILGFTCLALFVDGLLRILGIIPPFMHLDVNIIDKVADRVETDVIDKIRQVPIQRLLRR